MVRNRSSRRKVLVAVSIAECAYNRGIARYAREHDWHLVTDMMLTGAFPHTWKGDGILALVSHQPDLAMAIRESGIPSVAISVAEAAQSLPRVAADNVEIGRIAADHFLDRAYRNFTWAPFIDDQECRERFSGFQGRLAENGHGCHTLPPAHTRIGNRWHDDGTERRSRLLAEIQNLPRPTAIFASHDCVAADIIDACQAGGIAVPEEIAVLGVGNNAIVCESLPVSLSSVEENLDDIAYRAAGLLDQLMNGGEAPADVIRVPPKGVITRVSTEMRAVTNPRVAHALRFIAENYQDPLLGVIDVANAVGVSRRHLERSFRDETNCTIRDHIVKIRMQEASRLLTAHPRAKAADIAALVGAGEGSFFRSFQRYFGRSPKAHRKLSACPLIPHPDREALTIHVETIMHSALR